MRLAQTDASAIVSAIQSRDATAEIWLFGSRADDQARGGDIDLLVVSDSVSLSEKVDILIEIKSRIGDQKIDLHIVTREARDRDALARSVLPKAVLLTTPAARP